MSIQPSTMSARSEDEAAVVAVAGAFVAAWNRHDMSALASLFAPDADFVNVVGMWWRSRAEIEAAHVHSHSTFLRSSVLSGKVEKVKFHGPDIATVHTLWELRGQIEPDGSIGRPRHGILLFVVQRDGGRWSIHAAQNTDILADAVTRPAAKA